MDSWGDFLERKRTMLRNDFAVEASLIVYQQCISAGIVGIFAVPAEITVLEGTDIFCDEC